MLGAGLADDFVDCRYNDRRTLQLNCVAEARHHEVRAGRRERGDARLSGVLGGPDGALRIRSDWAPGADVGGLRIVQYDERQIAIRARRCAHFRRILRACANFQVLIFP